MTGAMNDDERAVRATHDRWIAAVNAGELETLLGMLADDVVLLHPGGAPIGRDGFAAGFQAGHRQGVIRCVSDPTDVVVAGDVAYTVSHDTLSVTPRDGGPVMRLAGDRLTVYRRQPRGHWLLARDAHTLTPEINTGAATRSGGARGSGEDQATSRSEVSHGPRG